MRHLHSSRRNVHVRAAVADRYLTSFGIVMVPAVASPIPGSSAGAVAECVGIVVAAWLLACVRADVRRRRRRAAHARYLSGLWAHPAGSGPVVVADYYYVIFDEMRRVS